MMRGGSHRWLLLSLVVVAPLTSSCVTWAGAPRLEAVVFDHAQPLDLPPASQAALVIRTGLERVPDWLVASVRESRVFARVITEGEAPYELRHAVSIQTSLGGTVLTMVLFPGCLGILPLVGVPCIWASNDLVSQVTIHHGEYPVASARATIECRGLHSFWTMPSDGDLLARQHTVIAESLTDMVQTIGRALP